MLQSYANSSKMLVPPESYSDDDSDYYDQDHDPGREVIEKNVRNRLQRIADYTKDELNKVLKRVDTTLNNYEHSVQSSLIQHGMSASEMSNVEHVADIKELEDLLNDSIAKQRYKQRLMVFIVGQTEQASEKAKLLQQIEQFFTEQKQTFGSKEFIGHDDGNEMLDEVDLTLRSFDVKDCYVHVQTLGTRLNELNEEIIQYLIENAGSKQQAKGKKKMAQVVKETKEQLSSLQSKLEMANNEMINRDNQIETLEKELDTLRQQSENRENKLHYYETEIDACKTTINELEDQIGEYKIQIEDLTRMMQETQKTTDAKTTDGIEEIKTEENDAKPDEIIVANQIDVEEVRLITTPAIVSSIEKLDKEIQTTSIDENSNNPKEAYLSFNLSDEIDPNNTTVENLQKHATTRIRDLLKESQMKESAYNDTLQSLQRQFNEYREAFAREQMDLIEKAETAYQLQIKAQKTAEEAISHLRAYMREQENVKSNLMDHQTQTDESESLQEISQESEQVDSNHKPIPEHSSAHSKNATEGLESVENFRRESLQDKYITLIEEKKQELDELKQQAEAILSRPGSMGERISFQSLENSAVALQQRPSISSLGSGEIKEYQTEVQPIIKQDEEQQTSRRPSAHEEKIVETDSYKLPFHYLYETIYKFRQAIVNLLEQNQLSSFANCLQMVRQLPSDEDNLIKDFLDNAERVLKDISKVLQTCTVTLQSTIEEYQRKEKEMLKDPQFTTETSSLDPQQSILLEQKDLMLMELTTKYEQLTRALNQTNVNHEAEADQNQRIIDDQQRIIQTLQHEATRLQKRLTKLETEGVVEPSIMFTRLDAERNDRSLQQAVERGNVSEITYNELNEAMTTYVDLPGQQLGNLVKRYIQFRRATELDDRIQSDVFDNDIKNVFQKMESLHERRSSQISQRMKYLRQQRANLARVLTDKFDELAEESSIFLIRPVYSYQGRAAAQSYMQHEKRRMEEFFKQKAAKRKHYPSRQSAHRRSTEQQEISSPLSPLSNSDHDERLFRIDSTVPSPSMEQKDPNKTKLSPVRFEGLTRLQELDIQRPLMPMTHASTSLPPAFTNNGFDPCVPSLNLRSYVALSRPGIGTLRMGKSNEIMTPVSRDGLSVLSAKSQTTNPRTPHNSSAGDLRRVGAPLPPIRRLLTTSGISMVNDRQPSGFAPSIATSDIPLVD